VPELLGLKVSEHLTSYALASLAAFGYSPQQRAYNNSVRTTGRQLITETVLYTQWRVALARAHWHNGIFSQLPPGVKDEPGLCAQQPVLFYWVKGRLCSSQLSQWWVGVGELGLYDTVLMAAISLARHACWVGVGPHAGKQPVCPEGL